tara:strand:- start:9543 stop:10730 length:1188 start_codon:yes stop_codon:yes gene_type:complete
MLFHKNEIKSCVVVETLYKKDPDFIRSVKKKLAENTGATKIFNSKYLTKCPAGSIIVRVPNFSSYMVLYPFFSSHFSLPVKPGEHVWAFFPEGFGTNDIGYWMTRRATDQLIEDVNFTHNTRAGYKEYNNVIISKNEEEESKSIYYGTEGRGFKSYNSLLKNTSGNLEHVFENVERVSKKPGDLLIQGSNNTQLLLTAGYKPDTGTIIMTAGRGATDLTASKTIENKSELEENNKASIVSRIEKENKREGQLDIVNDRAVLILSEDPGFINNMSATKSESHDFSEMSYFFVKADKIRKEARESIFQTASSYGVSADSFSVSASDASISASTVSVGTSGWSVDMETFFDIVEETIKRLSDLASGAATFATGVGPTGPATNVAELQQLLQKIKNMRG